MVIGSCGLHSPTAGSSCIKGGGNRVICSGQRFVKVVRSRFFGAVKVLLQPLQRLGILDQLVHSGVDAFGERCLNHGRGDGFANVLAVEDGLRCGADGSLDEFGIQRFRVGQAQLLSQALGNVGCNGAVHTCSQHIVQRPTLKGGNSGIA